MNRAIETHEFKNKSLFSNQIQNVLKVVILPFSEPQYRPAYRNQFDLASRNAEIMLERLGRLSLRHPLKASLVMRAIVNWKSSYFQAQQETRSRTLYDVYTEADDAIPFHPEEDLMYAYMLAQLAIVADEIADIINYEEMKTVVQGFMELNAMATEAFHAHPTVMPRFTEHDRITLRIIQNLDAPLNCCPSLHIAYSVYLDNIAEEIILERAGKEDVFNGIRYSTLRMFNSVLYTKQHALIDVAYGLLCAEIMYERHYRHRFNDLTHEFGAMAQTHPEINYDRIRELFERSKFLLKRAEGDFTEALGLHLVEANYTRLHLEEYPPAARFV